ncbi:MAG: DUF6320 domain-containing protein [Bacteroidales bacterium]
MRTCSHCGVELERNMNFCPLCGEPVMGGNNEQLEYIRIRKREQEQKLLTDYQKLSGKQKRKVFSQISGIILSSGIIITLIIDFMGDNTITWSKFPIAASVILFLNILMFKQWYNKRLVLFPGSFILTSIFLIFIDRFVGSSGWVIKIGIPLLLSAYIIIFTLIKLIEATQRRGLNIIAYSLLACGLLSICIEGIISLYTKNQFNLDWSIITMASVIPIAALLLFIHFQLKKVTDLKRFFHI